MIATYERIVSQLNKDIFMCPSDYPYLYMNNEKLVCYLVVRDIGDQLIKPCVHF